MMMPAASLSLLKGKKNKDVAKDPPTSTQEAAGEPTEIASTEAAASVAPAGQAPTATAATDAPFDPDPKEGADETEATAASAAVPATVAKKGKKPAVAKAGQALTGVIEDPDALGDIVHTVENLKQKEALALVGNLADAADFTFFKLGGVLSLIQKNSWYAPHESFRDYVEKEHGINYRRAIYWVAIYNDLSDAKVPWSKVKDLGWTKLKEIAGILSPENVDHWVGIAKQSTVLQLQDAVAISKKTPAVTDGSEPEEGEPSKGLTTTATFKVHADQKQTIKAAIEKAKTASQTASDTVALEFICLDYLNNGASGPMPADLKDAMLKTGLEQTLTALSEAFPDVNLTVELPEGEDKAA